MTFQKATNLIILLILINISLSCNQKQKDMSNQSKMYQQLDQAPKAAIKTKKLTIHGDIRLDPYYWLNQREDQEVIDYLNAENDYTTKVLAHTENFQTALFEEIKGRIKETDMSVPYKKNGYWYYTRFEEGKEYPIFCRKAQTLDNQEEILLNVNEMAKGFDYYQVGSLTVSPDNQLLAYSVDTVSRRKYTIFIKDLKTGKIHQDVTPNTTGKAVWANDNKTFFYTKKDKTLRAFKIYRHKLGNKTDKLVFHEKDDIFSCYIYKTKSNKYLVIGSEATLSSEMRVLDADQPTGTFKVIQERENNHEYHIAHFEEKFYVITNWEAQNFRLMETPINATKKTNWKEVIPHSKTILLSDIDIFQNYMVLSERKDATEQIHVIPVKGKDYYIPFEEDAFSAYPMANLDFDTQILRFSYTSMTTPRSVFDFDMESKQKTLLKQQEVIGTFNKDDYQSERIFVTSRDGNAQIPVSIVYKKGFKKDGTAPLLEYAYGSYGYSMDPYFSSVRLSLLDRGFVYVIAHIRGGQEWGRQWYEDGKLLKKKNTFTDFIDVGKYLVKHKYTSPDRLFAQGGSAGGLLMGAVINMAPELYKGAVAQVPFVDVVTTMLDESIPLTTGEYDEWGNPNVKEYYNYIKSYSPYDNIETKDYPALLVTTGLHDSQVQYWEPAKWVAKLRATKTDNNPLLLHTNMETGHSGASGRFEHLKEVALVYAFLFDLAGIEK